MAMAGMERTFGRSPTFLVNTDQQRSNLDSLVRREQHLAEQYQKNKPLMFNGNAYQKTHPQKAIAPGHRDADATVVSPMLLGCADGVSQIEEFGLDASELPRELLAACEEQATALLMPDQAGKISDLYRGPIPLMREAFQNTESMGSTTVCLSVLDNSTRIHGKLHPMMAIISIGDCELMVLRQNMASGRLRYETVFNTEMQRIGGNCQCPLQVCRVDGRIDAAFDERMTIEVIERGSAVHMVSVYEGDLVVIGSDGVFDNLFKDEVAAIVNQLIPRPSTPGEKFRPLDKAFMGEVARYIVEACHMKTKADLRTGKYPDTPIGKGGKRDDTCCVVGEVVEWTEMDCMYWEGVQRRRRMKELVTCGGVLSLGMMCIDEDEEDEEDDDSNWCRSRDGRDFSTVSFVSDEEEERARGCAADDTVAWQAARLEKPWP